LGFLIGFEEGVAGGIDGEIGGGDPVRRIVWTDRVAFPLKEIVCFSLGRDWRTMRDDLLVRELGHVREELRRGRGVWRR
jgi:hypothetical protein